MKCGLFFILSSLSVLCGFWVAKSTAAQTEERESLSAAIPTTPYQLFHWPADSIINGKNVLIQTNSVFLGPEKIHNTG